MHHSCCLLPLLVDCQVAPTAIVLGASYFQRLLHSHRGLHTAAVNAGFFSRSVAPGMGRVRLSMPDRALPADKMRCDVPGPPRSLINAASSTAGLL